MLVNKSVVKFIELDEQNLTITIHFIDQKSLEVKYDKIKHYDERVESLKKVMEITL